MDGVAAVIAVTTRDAMVTAMVPISQIMAGVMPQGTPLPAIGISSVSRIDRHPLSKEAVTFCRERVQVTVLAPTYGEMKDILRAVAAVGDASFPEVDGIADVAIHTDAAGPDFMSDDTSIHIGTQDFRVTYNQER